jgi:hypothetical protein
MRAIDPYVDLLPAGSVVRESTSRRVSVVIPTFNEATRLPVLLDHLDAQTRMPDEIVVADASSSDGTRAIALARGALVVQGGRPGAGRNAGAAAADGDVFLFMDADAEPARDFLERALAEFEERDLSIATAPMRATEDGWDFRLGLAFAEGYMRALQKVSPHAVGVCILVRRETHERIGGFDESVVLAEDHEYARRASRVGRYGVLRNVDIPTSMRRIHTEGRLHMMRVFWYSEVRTLAGIPIRRTPFAYEFGAFADTDARETEARPHGGPPVRMSRTRRFLRTLAKPSTETQTDALFAALLAVVAGTLGTTVMARAGLGPAAFLPFALLAAALAGAALLVAWRKLRFEKKYGAFFMASVAVSDVDIRDNDGRTIVRRGVDEVCEVHAIGSLDRMAQLNRQGVTGVLTIALETLEGIGEMIEDIDDPLYRDVRYVMGYSNLTGTLFKMGFDEIDDPPPLDAVNRFYKPILTRHLSKKMGRPLRDDVDAYRMAIASKEFVRTGLMASVESQIERVRRNLDRAQRLARADAAAGAAADAVPDAAPEGAGAAAEGVSAD